MPQLKPLLAQMKTPARMISPDRAKARKRQRMKRKVGSSLKILSILSSYMLMRVSFFCRP